MQHLISPIAYVSSPYTQKFGIPRQPNLVPQAKIIIELNPEFSEASVRGLTDFDYIWVHFIFHDAIDEGWAQMVRPPRLGGKQKKGVFATRSPHRPNHLGLSLLKLEKIETHKTVQLFCSGADLLNGTPVIDIKPYIPFVEAKTNARSGFAHAAPELLSVIWQPENLANNLDKDLQLLIEQSIAQDPRPAYQNIPEREYVMRIADKEVHFVIQERTANIIKLVEINN